jgi:hypothetical protein
MCRRGSLLIRSAANLPFLILVVGGIVFGQTAQNRSKLFPCSEYSDSACITEQGFLAFRPPAKPTQDEERLMADITELDHQAHEELGSGTAEWKEVLGILVNSANFLTLNEASGASELYKRSMQTFSRLIQEKNRVYYLAGLLLGVIAGTLFTVLLYLISRRLSEPFIPPSLLPLMCLFAGMGSLTSVLARLDTIPLGSETTKELIIVSGATRPIIAIFFALIIYLILNLKLVDIRIGSPTDESRNHVYLISSFLCGFSERFAQDILSKIGM